MLAHSNEAQRRPKTSLKLSYPVVGRAGSWPDVVVFVGCGRGWTAAREPRVTSTSVVRDEVQDDLDP